MENVSSERDLKRRKIDAEAEEEHCNSSSFGEESSSSSSSFSCDEDYHTCDDDENALFASEAETDSPVADISTLKSQEDEHNSEDGLDPEWKEIVDCQDEWFFALNTKTKLRRLTFQGVPPSHRGTIWKALSQIRSYTKDQNFSLFKRLVETDQKTAATAQIELDLDRTLVENALFNALPNRTGKLYDVLKAYAFYNTAVGYCQGMGPVVGCMLTQIESTEDVFWLLVTMLDKHQMARYYEPGMEGLMKDVHAFNYLLPEVLPNVARHLESNKLDGLMYLTPWFLSMYTSLANWELVLAIFDLFFVEGTCALFRFALAIIQNCEEEILAMNGIEKLMPYLLNVPASKLDTKTIIQAASKFDMDRLMTDCFFASSTQPSPYQRQRQPLSSRAMPSTPARTTTSNTNSKDTNSIQGNSLLSRMFSSFPTPVRSKLGSPFQSPMVKRQPSATRPEPLSDRKRKNSEIQSIPFVAPANKRAPLKDRNFTAPHASQSFTPFPVAKQKIAQPRQHAVTPFPTSKLAHSQKLSSAKGLERLAFPSQPNISNHPARIDLSIKTKPHALTPFPQRFDQPTKPFDRSSPLSPVKNLPDRPRKTPKKIRVSLKRRLYEDKENCAEAVVDSEVTSLKAFTTPTKIKVSASKTPTKKQKKDSRAEEQAYFSPSDSPSFRDNENNIEMKCFSSKKALLFD